MRTSIIIASLVGSFLVFAASVNLFDALFMLVLFGIVPGSTAALPAEQMLVVYMFCGSVIVCSWLRGGTEGLLRFLRANRSYS